MSSWVVPLVWFAILIVWAVWVSEKVRQKQHNRTRQYHLDLLRRELRFVSEQNFLSTHARQAAQDVLVRLMRQIEEGRYE